MFGSHGFTYFKFEVSFMYVKIFFGSLGLPLISDS